MLHE
jgi:hypothetical protein